MKNFSKYSRRGLPGGPNEIIEYMTGSVSTDGFKFDSADVNNDFNIIPSGDITMEDVMFPVFGIDNLGNSQMMFPEENYEFPGDMVFELPMARNGLEKYQFKGNVDDFRGFVKTPFILDEEWVERDIGDARTNISTVGENLGVDLDKTPGFYYQYDVNNPDNPREPVYFPFDELGNTGLADLNTQYVALPTTVVSPERNYLSLPYGIRKKNKKKTVDIDLAEDYDPDVPGSGGTAVYDPQGNFLGWDYKSDQRLAAEKVMNNPNLNDRQKRRLLRRIENDAILDFASPGGGRTYVTSGLSPEGGQEFINKYYAGMSDDYLSEISSNSGFFPGAEEESINKPGEKRLRDWERENQEYYDKHFGWAKGFKEDIGYPIARALATTPAIIAGGPAAINAGINVGGRVLGGLSTALNTPLISSAPYVTAGNALNTYFGTDFLFNRAPEIPGLLMDGDYGEAAKQGFFGGLDLLGLGAVAKSKQAYDLGRNLVNTVDDIEDVVRTTGTGFPGYNQIYNKADLKQQLDDLFQYKRSSPQNPRIEVNTGATTDLAKAQQDYFQSQGMFPRNTVLGAEDLTMYQQTDSYRDINEALGRYVETGEITPELAGILSRNKNYSFKNIGGRPTSNLTTQRIGDDEWTLVARGDEVVPTLMSDLKPGDNILDLKPTSVSDINAPGFQALGSNYQGPVTQITNIPAGSNIYNPSMQANQGMVRSMDVGDSELLLPVGSVRRFKGLDESGNFLFDLIGDYKNFKVGGNKSLPIDDSMLSTESGKILLKDDRYRDVRKKLGGSVMKRLAKILDEN